LDFDALSPSIFLNNSITCSNSGPRSKTLPSAVPDVKATSGDLLSVTPSAAPQTPTKSSVGGPSRAMTLEERTRENAYFMVIWISVWRPFYLKFFLGVVRCKGRLSRGIITDLFYLEINLARKLSFGEFRLFMNIVVNSAMSVAGISAFAG
jgi:hypothetical protein